LWELPDLIGPDGQALSAEYIASRPRARAPQALFAPTLSRRLSAGRWSG